MTYKVAIVGAGIGAQHLDGFATLPDRFEVSTICDLDHDRGTQLAKIAGCEHTTEFSEVLKSDVDIIDICLPPHLHFDTSVAALKSGKHVICEKPLVANLAEADALAEASTETGKRVYPVFQYRYGLGTAQFRALNAAGLMGKAYAATLETHWNRDEDYYAIDWRGTWAGESGGAILGHAIHIHDLISTLLGPVATVHAELATRVNEIEVEDCAALSMRMTSGTLVTSSVTLGAADDTSRLRILTEGMTIESDHAAYAPAAKSWSFIARAPFKQDAIDEVLAAVKETRIGYAGLFEAVADDLDQQGGSPVTIADGRTSLEFVTAVYHSSRNGQRVPLPIDRDNPLYNDWKP